MDDARARAELLTGVGALAAVAVAGLLATWDAGLGAANVALVLALLVAGVAAVGGRTAGAVTGLSAAISYNFFHTEPVHSLRIHRAADVVTVVLLALVGVAIGELGRRHHRSVRVADRSDRGLARVVHVAELIRKNAELSVVVATVEEEIRRELLLERVTFEAGALAGEERPLVDHDGSIVEPTHVFLDDGFALPATGADLNVAFRGRRYGRLVLVPTRPVGLPVEQLRCAAALADQLAAALATARHEVT